MTTSVVTPFSGQTADLLNDYYVATQGAQVVVVDNACPEETRLPLVEMVTALGGTYIRNDTNAGFAAANNQGYKEAAGDIIVFLNSDIAADPAWLKYVLDDVKPNALYGPSLAQQLVGGRWLPYLEGWCVAATRETWERLSKHTHSEALVAMEQGPIPDHAIGPWDALAYPGPYWEDNDLCWRALQAGISLIQTSWPIQHKGGRTAGAISRHAQSIEANRATFTARVMAALPSDEHGPTWGSYMQQVQTTSDIQAHLPLLFAHAKGTVVELGTRSGVSTAALLAGIEEHGGHVWSVDLDERSAGVAAGHPHWTFYQGSSMDEQTVRWFYDQEPGGLPRGSGGLIDCLLIDTDHRYEQAMTELELWHTWMRPGSVILMHDPETFPGVRRAAQEFAHAHNWPITFILPCNGMAVIEVPYE